MRKSGTHTDGEFYSIMNQDEKLDRIIEELDALRSELSLAKQGAAEKCRIIVENANDAMVMIDTKSKILYANPSMERIFGYLQSELVGEYLTILIPQDQRMNHTKSIQRYLDTGQRNLDWECIPLTGQHKDGQLVPIQVSFADHVEHDQHCFIGIIRSRSRHYDV